MRIIITGAAGFIGSALARRLAAQEDMHVHGLDKLTAAANPRTAAGLEALPHFTLHRLDILDQDAMQGLLENIRPAAILHLAAEQMPDRAASHATPVMQTNVMGSYHLLQAALRYWQCLPELEQEAFRFLHVSTDEIYGNQPGESRAAPDAAHAPAAPFAASKAAAEDLAQAWRNSYDLPVLIATPCHIYGSYQNANRFVPATILKAMHGEIVPIHGTGDHRREWLHVDDAVEGLLAVLAKGAVGRKYHLGSGTEIGNLALAQKICGILDALEPDSAHCPHRNFIQFAADRPGHDFRYALDSAASRALDWHPRIALDDGMERTVRWYLDNEDWWRGANLEYSGIRLGMGGVSREL